MKASAFIFIVQSPRASAAFYRDLLGLEPVYEADNFIQFNVRNDLEFGLWAVTDSDPAPEKLGGGAEICFHVDSADAQFARALSLGAPVLDEPKDLDFGRTFVVCDPDGYRVRFIQEFETGEA